MKHEPYAYSRSTSTSSARASASSGGIGVLSLLGILFVALKLLGKIDWSWWWVLAPFWMPTAILLLVALVALLIWTVRR